MTFAGLSLSSSAVTAMFSAYRLPMRFTFIVRTGMPVAGEGGGKGRLRGGLTGVVLLALSSSVRICPVTDLQDSEMAYTRMRTPLGTVGSFSA